MKTTHLRLVVAALVIGTMTGAGAAGPDGRTAPLFDDLGDHHHPITTASAAAQRYFDQGLILSFGFNHAEAVRSFREAQRLDPACAMCYWGEASSTPGRAEAAADRLTGLVPGIGHLVHMPAHIYLRVGRYHDATIANERASLSDESYISQCRAQGFYPAL